MSTQDLIRDAHRGDSPAARISELVHHTGRPWFPQHVRDAMRADFMKAHDLRITAKGERPTAYCPKVVTPRHRCGHGNCVERKNRLLDHCESFLRNGKQYAFTSQPYGVEHEALGTCCEESGLTAFVYGSPWSWYYPFNSDLLVFVARQHAEDFQQREALRTSRPWSLEFLENVPAGDVTTFAEGRRFHDLRGHVEQRFNRTWRPA